MTTEGEEMVFSVEVLEAGRVFEISGPGPLGRENFELKSAWPQETFIKLCIIVYCLKFLKVILM